MKYMYVILSSLFLLSACNRTEGARGNGVGPDVTTVVKQTAGSGDLGPIVSCIDPGECPDDLSTGADSATDLADNADLGTSPDLSDVDNPECVCGRPEHGLGLGHCKEQHEANSQGHGNGHCKFDCP